MLPLKTIALSFSPAGSSDMKHVVLVEVPVRRPLLRYDRNLGSMGVGA